MRLLFIASFLVFPCARGDSKMETTNLCHLQRKNISCSSDSVVFIDSARYGRMNADSCLKNTSYGSALGCSADVQLYLDRKCGGRRWCQLEQDTVLDRSRHGCDRELRTYLEVTYHCLRVQTPPNNAYSSQCDGNKYPIVMATSDGYLARVVTVETGIGSSTCPWSIEVRSGQTIRLTLYDFGIWHDWDTASPSPDNTMCNRYATITEQSGSTGPRIVCGGGQVNARLINKGSVVYTSNSNSIQVTVTTKATQTLEQFLLKYEVVGCADPTPPLPHTAVERISDRLVIKCIRDSDLDPEPKTWTIQCLPAGNWSIPLTDINCTTIAAAKKSSADFAGSGILLTIAISAAVIVAVLVITCGLFILYRRRVSNRGEEESQMPLPAGEYRFPPTTGPTSGYGSWAPTDGTPSYTPGAPIGPGPPAGPWAQVVAWPPGLERRPSADCLERDYATTLQMRLNALPCSSSSPSISSYSHHAPGSAATGPYGLPYDPRTMMVYCPFHGTLTRINGVEQQGRPRVRSEHNYEEVPLERPTDAANDMNAATDGNAADDGDAGNEERRLQQPLQRQPSGVYHELNY